MDSQRSLRARVKRAAGVRVIDGFFRGMSAAGRLHPLARPERHGVEVIRDVPYRGTGDRDHLLDVYRPLDRPGPLPVVLYVHGGGFRLLSKDTHWLMGLAFARRGFLVFNINYRLAPRHPFPAAIEDTCAAYAWITRNAPALGGAGDYLILAGESAGANLVAGATVAACYRRPEAHAREVFETGVVPRAVLPACGLLQVSDPGRFRRRKVNLRGWVNDQILAVSEVYLAGRPSPAGEGDGARSLDLADPLLVLERQAPDRPLPPFFAPVGTRDPLLDDTRRLKAALDRLGVPCEARYYVGELHAFHALVFRRVARQAWHDLFAFLDHHLGATAPAAADLEPPPEPPGGPALERPEPAPGEPDVEVASASRGHV